MWMYSLCNSPGLPHLLSPLSKKQDIFSTFCPHFVSGFTKEQTRNSGSYATTFACFRLSPLLQAVLLLRILIVLNTHTHTHSVTTVSPSSLLLVVICVKLRPSKSLTAFQDKQTWGVAVYQVRHATQKCTRTHPHTHTRFILLILALVHFTANVFCQCQKRHRIVFRQLCWMNKRFYGIMEKFGCSIGV